MSSVQSEILTFSLPSWMPFISFCFLIAEARNSSTMLINRDESRHPCHVPNLRGKALCFSLLKDDIPCGSFICEFYDVAVCSLYPYIVEGF